MRPWNVGMLKMYRGQRDVIMERFGEASGSRTPERWYYPTKGEWGNTG